MIINTIENTTVLYAEEGKVITNGESYGKEIWLGTNDTVSNWTEILETEIPIPEELI